ncbi:hypothetical protein CUN65_20975 [Enterobacter hormaechei subsp. xiangfangensis]|uniref:Uncharacterized protein n=1 Tax=Enterobacter hormaechei TaxID=158836 RepID=A0AAE7YMY9_9ENTR|nr:hypothetical protein CU081_01325 [Enterobacter sp. CRENT-193]AVO82151.1 hypothetical protein AM472_06770 [Enterobacter cloacae complex sp.]AWR70668.1 hypothetical protein CUN65_20975 [Enterobacter hormaechei subsp. xiangfangensis]AWX01540.1 hypothetical protein DPF84_07160 [Enterobacter hormaechei]AYU95988.1 hypothetical protein EEI76_13265 [Enterobacter cloacae]RYA39344.1 hypothetical protein DD605_17870 [Enterobacter cloacae complex sp. 3DZ3S2B]RYA39969.1 hypothetical protein DD603_19010
MSYHSYSAKQLTKIHVTVSFAIQNVDSVVTPGFIAIFLSPIGERKIRKTDYRISSSSTSNTRVLNGGMDAPAPRSP